MRSLGPIALPLMLAAACVQDSPVQYRVPDLRILAIRSSLSAGLSADADANDVVTLEALVANPLLRAPVMVDWFACAATLPAFRAPSPCTDLQRLKDPASFRTAADVVTIALDTSPAAGVSTVTLSLSVHQARLRILEAQAAILSASGTPENQCELYAEIPIVAVVRSAGLTETAVKRLRFHPLTALPAPPVNAYALNLNPVIPALGGVRVGASDPATCSDADGAPLEGATLGGKASLCGTLQAGSIGQYSKCDSSGPQTPKLDEEIAWQWYVTAGEIAGADFDGNSTGRSIDLTPAPGASTLWLIARDGRGGTGWRRWDLVVP